LAEVTSKNGVMLLSAGPTPEGTIPEEQLKTLKVMGQWLNLYGEAIYGTRPFLSYGQGTTEFKGDDKDAFKEFGALKLGIWDLNASDIRYTRKGNTVYAIQLGWNEDNPTPTLEVFGKEAKGLSVKSVTMLGSDEYIRHGFNPRTRALVVGQPTVKPPHANIAVVWKIELK
jgi:alpha-L-fucosidase